MLWLVLLFFFCLYILSLLYVVFFFFKQKTAYEMRISDWSSDVCSSDLRQFPMFADRAHCPATHECRRFPLGGPCRPGIRLQRRIVLASSIQQRSDCPRGHNR